MATEHAIQHGRAIAEPSGGELNRLAVSATVHCLTRCGLGEVTGMVIGTAAGFSEWGTVGPAVGPAFLVNKTMIRRGRGCASCTSTTSASSCLELLEAPSGVRRYGDCYGSTVKLNIMPLSWCSAMWQ